jgi:drug/metabolite transporter (DMT)-like permease
MNSIKGYLYVILAAVMWASSGTAGKGLFRGGISPLELVQVRVTLSSLLLAGGLVIFFRKLLRVRLRDLGYFLLLGGVAMVLMQGAYFYAISKIQVAAAILIQYLAPVLVAFFSVCFWNERLTAYKLLALILALAGCYLVVGGYNLQLLHMNLSGIMGGLGAAVSFAAYTLLAERGMHRYGPWTVLFYAMVFSALSLHIVYSPFRYISPGFRAEQWMWILYISLVGTILPFGLFFMGINHIRSTRAIITATLEPIAAGLMALIFLGEVMEPLQILGGGMVISAIVLLQVQKEQDELAPALIRANS